MKIIKFTESVNVSESLKYHLENNKPITENIFRPGSEAFYEVIKEARELFDLGRVNLCDVDKELYESTDIGKFGMYSGELVPLDLPMEFVVETNQPAFSIHDVTPDFKYDVMGKMVTNINPLVWTKNGEASCISFEGEVDGQPCKCKYDDGQDAYVFEAKYHNKEVKLNYPMRGGTKKYQVYVKNPKTGKVKKIRVMYSLRCEYFDSEFDTIAQLMDYVIAMGQDPNYEITRNGKGTGEMMIDLLQY